MQMTNAELGEFLESVAEDNPFLELQKPRPARIEGGGGRYEGLDAASSITAPTSLAEHLAAQIREMPGESRILVLAVAIAYELDDDGFFRLPLQDFASRNRVALKTAESALRRLQACTPAGVGARTLAECLRLQLEEQGGYDSHFESLMRHLGEAGNGYSSRLGKLTGLTKAGFEERMARIRRLDPRPGRAFAADDAADRLADMTVRADGKGGWVTELDTARLPRLLLNEEYIALVGTGSDPASKTMKALAHQAGWLKRTLDQRARTILRTAEAVVRRQDEFFRFGPSALAPMTLADVAGDIGHHVSTVSRVVTGKNLECSHGIFALKALFGAGVPARDGAVSAASVRHLITRLIAHEDAERPLTDDALVDELSRTGITIARRTVAKYRNALRIPVAGRRRRTALESGLRSRLP